MLERAVLGFNSMDGNSFICCRAVDLRPVGCRVVGFAEAITSRPWVVILLWLVIAAIALPLFAELSNVVKEEMYTLPPSAESMKAQKLIERIAAGKHADADVIIVSGVDLRDNTTLLRLVEWARELNKSVVDRYAAELKGIPFMLAEANASIYEMVSAELARAVNGSETLYSLLEQLDEAYSLALGNASSQVRLLNDTLRAVMEADKGYAEAYKLLVVLSENLDKTVTGLTNISRAYAETTDKLYVLAENMTRLARAIQLMDKEYSQLYQGLKSNTSLLLSLLSNKTLISSLEELLSLLWWQVSRTYYYMELYNGNYTAYATATNLTTVDPRLAPLPREQALYAWKETRSLVESRGLGLDEASLAVAASMFRKQLPSNASLLAPVLVKAWNKTLQVYKQERNTTCLSCLYSVGIEAALSQLRLLNESRLVGVRAAEYTAENSADIAVDILSRALAERGVPASEAKLLAQVAVSGELSPKHVASVIAKLASEEAGPVNATGLLASILASYDPEVSMTLAGSWDKAVDAAATIVAAMGAPGEAAKAVAELVKEYPEPSREQVAAVAAKLLSASLPAEAQPLLDIVVSYDPEGRGVVAEDSSLALGLAVDYVYKAATAMGVSVDRGLVEKIAELVASGKASREALQKQALSLVAERAREERGEGAAKVIVAVLERYDPSARGVLASDPEKALEAVLWLAELQGQRTPFTARDLLAVLKGEKSIEDLVASVFVEESAGRAPLGARHLVEELARIVVREGPGIPSEEKWRIVRQLVLEQMRGYAGATIGAPLPPGLAGEVVDVAIMVARGHLGLEEAARDISERVLLAAVAPRLLEEASGTLVSRDLKSFTVMVAALGEGEKEKAENTMRVGDTARKLLESLGFNAEVYVDGKNVLLYEVREYAIRDVEKTSKLSELGTFIVLLVLLESLLAVTLPYIGIVLGLALGGAIVYIAASHGMIDLSSHIQSIMVTTALGLGADYAGYLIYRFKEEYALTGDAREAARRSLKRAGPAIVASALTVVIGFGSLLLAWDISFLRGFGQAIPIAVAATALASLTLVPALLTVIGGRSWFWWPRRPRQEHFAAKGSKLMKALVKHRRAVLSAMAVLIVVSGYFYAMFQGTHDMKLMLPENAPAYKALKLLGREFYAGVTDPILVVVELPENLWESNASWSILQGLVEEVYDAGSIGVVMAPTHPTGKPLDRAAALEAGGRLFTSSDGRLALIQIVLSVDPYSSEGIKAIREIHRIVHSYAEKHNIKAYMGGTPYATLEMDNILTQQFYQRVLPAAALLMALTFTAIFGGLWISIASLLVIIGAAMTGIMASTILFKYIFGKEMLWFMHIVTLAAVMGVGMDYNSFFLARALEECHKTGCDPEKSVVNAAGRVSKFIVGLSLVVAIAYATLLVAENTGMKEMGFALATTVLVAALMASYLLTPLVVSVLGKHAWWPWGLKKRIEH